MYLYAHIHLYMFISVELTQMVYGFSRDDCSNFINDYIDRKIFASNPFDTIDKRGVGSLLQLAVDKMHKSNRQCRYINLYNI